MPERHVDVLLIGGGIASVSCAATLREESFGGSILLVSREPEEPYHRPPITKGYLQGSEDRDATRLRPPGWFEQHDVELLSRTSVMALDTAAQTATLSTKDVITYEQALLATGANVRRLQVDGAELDGIHYLRALSNADALREEAAGRRVVLVGGSYIACEVAASLTATADAKCTLLMLEADPLERHFGPQAGAYFRSVLENHGVQVLGGEEVASFSGEGRVSRVHCKSGREVDCEVVVAGVGAMPDVMLARRAGLELGESGGIACDAALRTSAAGVLAAGDVCEYASVVHGRTLRVEHEVHAEEQGATAARTIMGSDAPHSAIPYFFSDLADWTSLEYVGPAASWDEERLDGSTEEGAFSIDYIAAGELVARLSVGGHGDLDEARELITSGPTDKQANAE